MLNKLIQKRDLILIVSAAILIAACIITLILSSREDKLQVLVLSLILPFVIYGFIRFTYLIVSKNASLKTMTFFYCFFLIVASFGTISMLISFIGAFPNGLSPTLGACGAIIVGTLDSAKKSIHSSK